MSTSCSFGSGLRSELIAGREFRGTLCASARRASLDRPDREAGFKKLCGGGGGSTAACGANSLKPDSPIGPSHSAGGVLPDDAELVSRAQARDTGAFRELVERHRDRAYSLALRMLRSPADAEEVTQDALVRAWIALPQFRGESRFSTWLHRIVARRAIDRAAVLKRRRGRETGIEAAEQMAGATGESDAARAIRLERMIADLNDAQRAVVALFYYEGRSVDQVASILGMPSGTVKTHLSRARALLRGAWMRETSRDTSETRDRQAGE